MLIRVPVLWGVLTYAVYECAVITLLKSSSLDTPRMLFGGMPHAGVRLDSYSFLKALPAWHFDLSAANLAKAG